MVKNALMLLVLLAVTTFGAVAQESAKSKPDDRTPALTPLRVQVVFSEYDGDKKVSSLPYLFSVNSDERRARPATLIRNGVRTPVSTGKEQFTYIDVGTNLDCSATLLEDGRYKLQMTLDRSSLLPDNSSGNSNPVVRQFKVEINQVLKDGQTVESVVSTDPLNGHSYHVSVSLNVVKP
jgi:hypothetical protein